MPIEFPASFWEHCWTHRRNLQGDLRCAILAAGLGRRLEPLTARLLPKPLFPLGGKLPLAEIWVRRLVQSGITDVSMNLCVLAETIARHFGDGSKFCADIKYVFEKTPTGTLGGVCKQALGRTAKILGDEPPLTAEPFAGSTLIAPSGDIVTNFDAGHLEQTYEIHKRTGAAFTIVLVPVPWERRRDFGTVLLDDVQPGAGEISRYGRVRDFREKDPNSPSNLNNASIYLIEMDLIRELDALRTEAKLGLDNPFYDFGKHVFPAMLGQIPYAKLSRDYPLVGVQYDGAWFDVGQKRDYLRVNQHLLDGDLKANIPYDQMPWGYLGTDVAIDFSSVKIIPPVVIGNHCTIEPGATVGPYAVIGDGWVLQRGSTVRNSVLWEIYPSYDEAGRELSVAQRRLLDRHEIREGVTIDGCIVSGGALTTDFTDQTVEVLDDGRLRALSIDYVPDAPRV